MMREIAMRAYLGDLLALQDAAEALHRTEGLPPEVAEHLKRAYAAAFAARVALDQALAEVER